MSLSGDFISPLHSVSRDKTLAMEQDSCNQTFVFSRLIGQLYVAQYECSGSRNKTLERETSTATSEEITAEEKR